MCKPVDINHDFAALDIVLHHSCVSSVCIFESCWFLLSTVGVTELSCTRGDSRVRVSSKPDEGSYSDIGCILSKVHNLLILSATVTSLLEHSIVGVVRRVLRFMLVCNVRFMCANRPIFYNKKLLCSL